MPNLVFSRMPVPGQITTQFGQWLDTGNGPYQHRGIDIGCPDGTPVHAPAAGRSVAFTNDGTFGHHSVTIQHLDAQGAPLTDDRGNPMFSLYAHLQSRTVEVGAWIEDGQLIGLSGHEGFYADGSPIPYGPHVHWQPCINAQFPVDISYSRDPFKFLITEDSPMTPAELARLERTERMLAGNGYIATPRPDTADAKYSQIFAEELALRGGQLVEYRGTPPVAGGKVSTITVSAEGADGPAYMLTGERALKYADWRGFSLGLALEYKANAS